MEAWHAGPAPMAAAPAGAHPVLTIGGTAQTGTIGVSGEVDRFAVQLTGGQRYHFELASKAGGLRDSELVLRNGSGSKISSDVGGTKAGAAEIDFVPTTSGSYYLDAQGGGGSKGGYQLQGWLDDFANHSGTSALLAANGSSQAGAIQYGHDADHFRIELEAGTAYQFEARAASGSQVQPALRLLTASGETLAGVADAGSKAQTSYLSATGGTYYVAVSASSSAIGDYTVRATPIADDFAASTATLGTVKPNGPAVTGQLERSGDIDWMQVTLQAGTAYVFSVEGSGSKGAALDTLLQVRSAGGKALASNDDAPGSKNGGSQLSFVAPSSGTYYLDVSSDAGQTGAYTVTATATATATTDDYPASPATAGVAIVGGTATNGSIERAGDADWLRVDLHEGILYDFQLAAGSGSKNNPGLAAPALQLRTPDGSTVYGAGEGSKAKLGYVAPADGTYYLVAQARDGVSTGSYGLTAAATPDDLPSSRATTGLVQVNGGGSKARIDAPADTDFFRVELVAGTTYQFALAGTGGAGSLVDTTLRLLGPDGALLAANDDSGSKNGSSALTFQAPSTGNYYLEASGDGQLVGGYQLSASVAAQSVGLTGLAHPDLDLATTWA